MTQQIEWIISHLNSISDALKEIWMADENPDAKECLGDAICDVHDAKAALEYLRVIR